MRIFCYLTAAIVCCGCASSGPPVLSQANGKIYELNWDMRAGELGNEVLPIPGTNHVPLQPRRQVAVTETAGQKPLPPVALPAKPAEALSARTSSLPQSAVTPSTALGGPKPLAIPVAPMYTPTTPALQMSRTAVSTELAVPTKRVKLYFVNSSRTQSGTCPSVYFVEREVPAPQSTPQEVLTELIKGPSEDERAKGYASAFENGTKFKSLKVSNGLAEVRFDPDFKTAKGACARNTLRMQIVSTLQQFPEVNRVGITAGTESW